MLRSVSKAVCSALLAGLIVAGCGGGARVELQQASAGELLAAIRQHRARVVLVNVWATWCLPCREELPDLVRLEQKWNDHGLELLFVSGDFPEQREEAAAFLAEHGVRGRHFLMTGDQMEFIDGLSEEWSGAMPASFLYGAEGRLHQMWEGRVSYEELDTAVRHLLAEAPDSGDHR